MLWPFFRANLKLTLQEITDYICDGGNVVSLSFGLHGPSRNIVEPVQRAQLAEELGFDSILFADSHMNNLDPFQVMIVCAAQTKHIRLGTAVTNMVYRDPTVLASSAGTLEECVARVKRLEEAGARRILLTPPNSIYDEVMEAWGRRVIPRCRHS